MNGLVALPLAISIVAALVAAPRLAKLHPAGAARSSTIVLLAVTIPALPTLWLLGFGGLARIGVRLPALDWCRHLLPQDRFVGIAVGIAALLWAIASTVRCAQILAMHRRLRVTGQCRYELIDTDDVFAYTLPGPAGAIAVSRGLRDQLDDDEFNLVLAHEEAHVAHRHDRLLLVALLARAVVPPIATVARWLEHHIERWADEDALAHTGAPREVAARTIAKVALAAPAPRRIPALGFAGPGVVARTAALLAPPTVPSLLTRVSGGLALTVVLTVATIQVHRTAVHIAGLLG